MNTFDDVCNLYSHLIAFHNLRGPVAQIFLCSQVSSCQEGYCLPASDCECAVDTQGISREKLDIRIGIAHRKCASKKL